MRLLLKATLIKTADDLNNIRNNTDASGNITGKYILMNDIDLSSYANWDPIGDFDTDISFTGTLDGNGYVVKNLTINRPTEDGVGLFAIIGDVNTMSGGEVKNLGLENVDVEGNNGAAGLADGNVGNIDNCYVIGDISGKDSIGGLVVQNFGTVSNSYTTGTVTANRYTTGGLVAHNETGTVINSHSNAVVTGNYHTGGLVGLNYSGTISNSYATGNVKSSGPMTGGLVGYIVAGTISNSYATGNVKSSRSSTGGLVGNNYIGTISYSYATGLVQGTTEVGGLVGRNGTNAKIKNSIWNTQTTGQNAAYGSDDGTGTFNNNKGLTTSEMQDPSNWSGWDDSVWDFSTYPPKLKWQTQNDNPSDIPKNAIRLQIGADSTGTSVIYVDTSFDLGAFDVDFSSADSCAAAIEDIDEVLSRINTKRSEFGAVINRLSSILESQTTTIQNFTSAQSTIMDADIANESADFVKNQILQQTSSALLAQSQNLHASIVLSLIG